VEITVRISERTSALETALLISERGKHGIQEFEFESFTTFPLKRCACERLDGDLSAPPASTA
jgi:hypothetical protein